MNEFPPDVNLEPPDVLPVEVAPDVNLEPPDVLPVEVNDPRLELVEIADPLLKEPAKLAPEEKHPAHNCPLPMFLIREPPILADPVLTTATVPP